MTFSISFCAALLLIVANLCGASANGAIALRPAMTGIATQTLISVPIANPTSRDYAIASRDATERQQFQEACGNL